MKILFVEDDRDVARIVKEGLSSDAFTVEIAEDGSDGSFFARSYEYDVIILDNSLPKKSGLDLCREIRSHGKSVPIIFLSVNNDASTKVAALESGADDYMTKPFSLSELRARIRALVRRPKEIKQQDILKVANVIMDTNKQTVKRGEQNISLTRKEFKILECLMRNYGTVLSRSTIMEHVWTADSDPLSNTVEAHVRNIRRKLNVGCKPDLINNMPGRGYIIDEM